MLDVFNNICLSEVYTSVPLNALLIVLYQCPCLSSRDFDQTSTWEIDRVRDLSSIRILVRLPELERGLYLNFWLKQIWTNECVCTLVLSCACCVTVHANALWVVLEWTLNYINISLKWGCRDGSAKNDRNKIVITWVVHSEPLIMIWPYTTYIYSSEFRVHVTTKMYNSCVQTRDNCMQQ